MARAGHPLSAYATAVDLLQARLALLLRPSKHHFNFGSTKKGDKISVLFTTDSKEPEFIESLTRLGWTFIDHDKLKTVKRYGGWYPAVIDSLILSRGVGFVGSSFPSLPLPPFDIGTDRTDRRNEAEYLLLRRGKESRNLVEWIDEYRRRRPASPSPSSVALRGYSKREEWETWSGGS